MAKLHPSLAEALSTLYGESLGSITFVEDYLQLGFRGGRVTIVVHPRLLIDGEEYLWNDPQFCTKLRAQIGVSLRNAEVTDAGITLTMANGTRLAAVFSDEPNLTERFLFAIDSGKTWIA
jgi:hypothetical protein